MSKIASKKSTVQIILENKELLSLELNGLSFSDKKALITAASMALHAELENIEPIPWEEVEAKANQDFKISPIMKRLRDIRDEMSKTLPNNIQ